MPRKKFRVQGLKALKDCSSRKTRLRSEVPESDFRPSVEIGAQRLVLMDWEAYFIVWFLLKNSRNVQALLPLKCNQLLMLYSNALWEEWCLIIEKDFKIKGYEHFDHKFDFPKRKEEIRQIVSDPAKVAAHSFLPLVKILIKTPRFRYQENEKEYGLETKIRPISFASHFDTYLYAWYSFVLTKEYQSYIHKNGISDCVLAYRTDLNGHCNIQFAKEVFDYIKGKGHCTAIALDIKGYFDNIDHQILKEKWCKILGITDLPEDQYRIFRSLTAYTYVNKNTIEMGLNLPQLNS